MAIELHKMKLIVVLGFTVFIRKYSKQFSGNDCKFESSKTFQ